MSDSISSPETESLRADAHSQRGMERLEENDAAGAALEFRAAIAASPAHLEARHGLIRALIDTGEPEAAVAAAIDLAALTPDDPLALTSLSIALQNAGKIPEAEAAAGRARILEWKQQLAAGSEPNDSEPHSPELHSPERDTR